MALAPFGVLNVGHQKKFVPGGYLVPMKRWNGDEASFAFVMQRWLDQVKDTIWPAWENGAWTGGATARMEAETVTELNLAVELYHGTGKDDSMLDRIPDVPAAPNGRRFDHRWHYQR